LISPVLVRPSCQQRKVRLPGFMGVPWASALPPAVTTRAKAGRAARRETMTKKRALAVNRRAGRRVFVRIMTSESFRYGRVDAGVQV